MILLTGATGTLGKPLLARLIADGHDVRVLVREPRRLGPARVQVQIAIGNLGDHRGFGNAVRGVETVIHLAATTRDQMRGSIEEMNGVATSRLVTAAQRAGVRRFVYVSSIGASTVASSRFIRTQAHARDAVAEGDFESLIFEASIIYAPGDPWLSVLSKLSYLPVLPVPGDGKAKFQPIYAEDAAEAIAAALPGALPAEPIELVGPEILTHNEMLKLAMKSFGRERPLLHLSPRVARKLLRLEEWYLGPSAFATWDEAQLMDYSSVATRGTADLNSLGLTPAAMVKTLGASKDNFK